MTATVYFHIHLVSDSTGETLNTITRAAVALFDRAQPIEHAYFLVRSRRQLDRAIADIQRSPGMVMFTLANDEFRSILEQACRDAKIPCVPVLDPILGQLSRYLGLDVGHRVAAQRTMDEDYFRRLDALNFAMAHDDGQMMQEWEAADVVLVGISRTSKTPTSIYLANRGIKAANYPLVGDGPPPQTLLDLKQPLIVGLKISPERVIAIRRNRLLSLHEDRETNYIDEQTVRAEATAAARLFERAGWPTIDVTRRSIEETAAAIINLLRERNDA